jgi:hypothetical protein
MQVLRSIELQEPVPIGKFTPVPTSSAGSFDCDTPMAVLMSSMMLFVVHCIYFMPSSEESPGLGSLGDENAFSGTCAGLFCVF